MFKQNKIQGIMKKQYIIPEAEVVEIKTNQLLMTSTMSVDSTNQLENSSDILSREYNWLDE
jgi:hypothetical protein